MKINMNPEKRYEVVTDSRHAGQTKAWVEFLYNSIINGEEITVIRKDTLILFNKPIKEDNNTRDIQTEYYKQKALIHINNCNNLRMLQYLEAFIRVYIERHKED